MSEKYDSPDFLHPDYVEQRKDLELVLDCWDGTQTLRAKRRKYLPQFPKEPNSVYHDRVNRSVFVNYFERTVEGLVGMVFRKAPTIDGSSLVNDWLETADGGSENWITLAKTLFAWAIRDGHSYLLTDMAPVLEQGSHLGDEARAGRRPYWIPLPKEAIVNWSEQHITIKEIVWVNEGSFGVRPETRYRVIRPNDWELWTVEGKGKPKLSMSGVNTLGRIPLAVCYAKKTGWMKSRPLLRNLIELNIAHFQQRSDLHNIMHVCNVPILYAVKRTAQGKDFVIGPSTFIDVDEGGSVAYAEHRGFAISSTQDEIKHFERQMAMLGIAVLADQTDRQPETATERILDAEQESSVLLTAAHSLAACLNQGIGALADFGNVSNPGTINLGVKPRELTLDANKIAVFSGMVAKDQLSVETLWQTLALAGELPPDFNEKTELVRVQAQAERRAANLNLTDNGALL